MDSIRVSWGLHVSTMNRRVGPDREPGGGVWVDTVLDHDGQPAAVVVRDDRSVVTVRLSEVAVDPEYVSKGGTKS